MSALLRKEIRLSSLPLTWLFISFGVMTLIPGYPILCSVFFITLGIYQSFQSAREANDILYSALLPVAKNDVVKGKYQFVMTVELCGFGFIHLQAECADERQSVLPGRSPVCFRIIQCNLCGRFFQDSP